MNTLLPTDLIREWGKDCTLQWVSGHIQNRIDEAGIDASIPEYEINMSRGSERKVHLEFYNILFQYHLDTINYLIMHNCI